MARLLELTRGDGRLDTVVRSAILGALLLLCVALVGTTLFLRNQNRSSSDLLLQDVATFQGAHLER